MHPSISKPSVALTPRERTVLIGLAEGLVCKQVAAEHGISLHTVRTHVRRIFYKLGTNTLAHAVLVAARAGWLDEAVLG